MAGNVAKWAGLGAVAGACWWWFDARGGCEGVMEG